ncbi:2-amino-4-hydroxy-6-hydroxymethyldihydropteridine diphosphokinase [Sulfitobacter pacificus]|uniref:2-amino-4-hydroxy-6- hydroxymethyldihydropteridine diphosphokinase n=1 Tax=Sulfitobacter pacificus TaxID=1499314 RepID=UPI003109072E
MPQAQDHGEKSGSSLISHPCMLLALGANLTSNVGAPEITLRAALKLLKLNGATIRAKSALYSTPAFPAGNGPDYVNAAARISAPWDAAQALAVLHDIEAEFGRTRETRWGQRTLDLDLIAFGDQVLPDRQTYKEWRDLPADAQRTTVPQELILPHPRLQDRAFVLVPLADVAPDWVHPVLKLSVTEMRDALDPADLAAVRVLSEDVQNNGL